MESIHGAGLHRCDLRVAFSICQAMGRRAALKDVGEEPWAVSAPHRTAVSYSLPNNTADRISMALKSYYHHNNLQFPHSF